MRLFGYKSALALMSVAAALSARTAGAQRVDGRVREAVTGAPVAGAVVSLNDSSGHLIARTISAADGGYHLAGDGRAMVLRAIRIGYRPATDSLPPVVETAALTRDVTLTPLPTLLEAVQVDAPSTCPASADGPAAFALWEQVRAALLATVVAREANPPNVRVLLYDRILDAGGRRVERQIIADSVFTASTAFVSGRTAAEYETRGYRDRDAKTRSEKFYGPDADVLIDPAFVRTHCFSLRDHDASHPDEIGLAFAPTPERDTIVDVSGVIWVRRTNPTLRSMDFRFTHLDGAETDAGTGGSLRFDDMPNGVLLGTRWKLHVPLEGPRRGMVLGGRVLLLDSRARVVAMRDIGGVVAEATWPDGTLWRDSLSTVRGTVVRAGTTRPVAHAIVRLNDDGPDSLVVFHGSAFEAVTDSAGTFSFPPLLDGPYTARVDDAALAALGISVTSATRLDAHVGVTDTSLTLPPLARVIDSLCGNRGRHASGATGGNFVLGRVVEQSGAPAESALVQVRWRSSGAAPLTFAGTTDHYGLFEVCDAPSGVPITVSATADSLVSAYSTLTLDAAPQIGSVSLTLTRPSAAALPSFRRREIRFRDDASGRPLPDVELLDAVGSRTLGRSSDSGVVSLAVLPEGSALLRARRPGYEQRLVPVMISPTDSQPITLRLRTVTQLEAIRVTAAPTSRRAMLSGFDERAARGLGHFLTGADFARMRDLSMQTVLTQLGLRQTRIVPGGRPGVGMSAGGVIMSGGHLPGICPVTIYIDGSLFYSGASHMPPPDVSILYTDDYAAAEYYAGGAEIPAEYSGTDTDCGVLLLWTRQ